MRELSSPPKKINVKENKKSFFFPSLSNNNNYGAVLPIKIFLLAEVNVPWTAVLMVSENGVLRMKHS